jgi:DNA-binding transcriptional LysR family regulator
MHALPVDIVRAFVAIVDCRGFTRAAEQLGRSQPTISLQIRRLEELIGAPVFEKSARLTLTARGRTVLEHGRKLVAAHDELVEMLKRHEGAAPVRLGMPNEFSAFLASRLVDLATRRGEPFAFEVTCDQSETLLDRVRAHQLDVALAMTSADQAEGSVAHWPMPLTWVVGPGHLIDETSVIRLITPPEGTLFYNIAAEALTRAGRTFEIVCKSASPDVLRSAVEAGCGVSLAPRALARRGRTPLTPLPEVTLGLFAREGDAGAPLLAHMIDLVEASPALAA